MITEQQQEMASLYALGALDPAEAKAFEKELLDNPKLLAFTRSLERTADLIAGSVPPVPLPPSLKEKVLQRIETHQSRGFPSPAPSVSPSPGARPTFGGEGRGEGERTLLKPTPPLSVHGEGGPKTLASHSQGLLAALRFADAADTSGWKALPVPGAFIKLLSLEKERGYAVLMGRLDPGARYPAHVNAGPEDFVVLTGDLHIGQRRLGPGDFHHADRGSQHEENHSVAGCTLIAVLTTDDPLVTFAMA